MRVAACILAFLLVFISHTLSGCEQRPSVSRDKVQEAWDSYNNPAQLDSGSVVFFDQLPTVGTANKIPWTDIYWPSWLGGISLRWRDGIQASFTTPRLTEADVRAMSPEQRAGLSPAEKYDIYMGRFDFPTVQAELMRTHPAMPKWFGLCHGWASASLNYDEPLPVTVRGYSDIDVAFASADIKALLAYAQGVVFMPVARSLGQRCEVDFVSQPHMRNSAACRDTNAGSFHLILSNLIGRQGESFIADLSNGSEVWNFPIYSFSSREISRQPASVGAALQAVSEVIVETDVNFIDEVEQPAWLPFGDSRPVASKSVRYQYAVELDSLGRVVGGRWLSDERPDFLWKQERADYRGYYAAINAIYESSLSGIPPVIDGPRGPTPQPEPTVMPIPTPPPAPTAPPLPTPPPVPTIPAVPSAPPSVNPDQPIAPVLTEPLPMPAPVNGQPSGPSSVGVPPAVPAAPGTVVQPLLSCPSGSRPEFTPVAYCTDGVRAFAPYTRAMLDKCVSSGFAGCFDSTWTNQLYLSLRGVELCPAGAVWNVDVSACIDGSTVLGPFSQLFADTCVANGFGNICYAMKIDIVYYSLASAAR